VWGVAWVRTLGRLNRNRATSSRGRFMLRTRRGRCGFPQAGGDLGGGARNSLQEAIGYAKERKAFGNGINPRRDLFEKLSAEIARQIGKRPPLKTPHGACFASSALAYLRASAFRSASASSTPLPPPQRKETAGCSSHGSPLACPWSISSFGRCPLRRCMAIPVTMAKWFVKPGRVAPRCRLNWQLRNTRR
jgi:hypothetical protein